MQVRQAQVKNSGQTIVNPVSEEIPGGQRVKEEECKRSHRNGMSSCLERPNLYM